MLGDINYDLVRYVLCHLAVATGKSSDRTAVDNTRTCGTKIIELTGKWQSCIYHPAFVFSDRILPTSPNSLSDTVGLRSKEVLTCGRGFGPGPFSSN
jgi:hypothetical protein